MNESVMIAGVIWTVIIIGLMVLSFRAKKMVALEKEMRLREDDRVDDDIAREGECEMETNETRFDYDTRALLKRLVRAQEDQAKSLEYIAATLKVTNKSLAEIEEAIWGTRPGSDVDQIRSFLKKIVEPPYPRAMVRVVKNPSGDEDEK